MNVKKQIPCLDGWFTMPPEEPGLIGNKYGLYGHYFFPKVTYCRNLFCDIKKPLEKAVFSRKGKLMAFTINRCIPAQALAETHEIVVQLRGDGGARQVEGAKVGFSVNSGKLGNFSALVYKR